MVETVKKFLLIKEMPVCIHLTIVTSFFHIMFSYIWGLFKLARGDLKKKNYGTWYTIITRHSPKYYGIYTLLILWMKRTFKFREQGRPLGK